MKKSSNLIIAIDGHDGSGKTTLAKLLSEKVGGIYIRPFGGNIGMELIQHYERKDYKKVASLGNTAIRNAGQQYNNEILVYDRHWMTVFSLLPESYWDDKMWHPLPATTLCFSDLEHSLARLKKRVEKSYEESYHQYYLDLYTKLANRYDAQILRTDQFGIDACLKELSSWYEKLLTL